MHDAFTVATYNVHGGVDAWGRPIDAAGDAAALDADVYLLQENWIDPRGDSVAQRLGALVGGRVEEVALAHGRRGLPHPDAGSDWHRHRAFLDGDHALYVDSELPLRGSLSGSERFATAEEGSWGIAVVSRLEILTVRILDLGRRRRDRARRLVLVAQVSAPGGVVEIACVHMSHLIHGSPAQIRRLGRTIGGRAATRGATILGGDMNCWSPPLRALLPGWQRAVSGPTWPAWKPHSQLDHLLVGHRLDVLDARIAASRASDHLPVVATVALR